MRTKVKEGEMVTAFSEHERGEEETTVICCKRHINFLKCVYFLGGQS